MLRTLVILCVIFISNSVCASAFEAEPPTHQFEFAYSANQQVVEYEMKLPKMPCNSELDVCLKVRNPMGTRFHANAITTSCGCISRLPSEWSLAEEEVTSLTFRVRMPRTREEATKYVTLSDNETGVSIRLSVRYTALPLVSVPEVFDLTMEGRTEVLVPIEANFESVDLHQWKCKAVAGISNASLAVTSKEKGSLLLEMDASSVPQGLVELPCAIEFLEGEVVKCRVPVTARFLHRVAVVPNPIVFERIGEVWYANAVVQSQQLHDWLRQDKKPTFELLKNSNRLGVNVAAECTKTDSPVSMFRFQVPAGKRMEIDRIRIVAGDWSVETPAKFNNP